MDWRRLGGGVVRDGLVALLGAAIVAAGAGGCGGSSETSSHPADGSAVVPGDGGADTGPPANVTAPTVTDLRVPMPAGGIMPLVAVVDGVRAAPVQVSVEVSTDAATFHAATVATAVPPGATGHVEVSITWQAIADLGLRANGTVTLRLTAQDPQGSGPPTLHTIQIDNLRAAARSVDHYLANYGAWSADTIALGQRYQMVIAHPGRSANLTRAQVAALQAGADPLDPTDDVIVLCYVSVGEDLRTASLTDDQVRADPRFRGDGTGPRIDPRGGPEVDGMPLGGIDPRGKPSNGGTGFASYYLDDNDVHNSATHVGNGFPDRNLIFGGAFVNAGDPAWFDVVDAMTVDGADRLAGFREVMTAGYGRGLDCDGVFLDTIDTAAPNAYTNASSRNQSEYEWTAPGFTQFIRHIHSVYPDKLILQNRGLFFFDPRKTQYAFNARGAVDFVLFESFRLDSNAADLANADHYPDNRYNVAPKLMAEANRPDGFTVVSLGYAVGPADQMSSDTLFGKSTLGFDDLMEDIHVTQDQNGFRHYLTGSSVSMVNSFVLDHASLEDHVPPAWSSTYNDHTGSPAGAPTPRVGIQQAVSQAAGQITVRWDVALDMHRVKYTLYAQPQPFDFAGDPALSHARAVPLVPTVPASYLTSGVGVGRYPYEATVSGFPGGQPQYLIIRATDSAPTPNQEQNTVVLTVTP
jgi:hypothetical protein